MSLPTPDPAQGGTAEQEAAQARRTLLESVREGDTTLTTVFSQIDEEGPHHQLGHIHTRALLIALPHIGEIRALEILAELELDGSEHIDELGTHQRQALEAAVTEHGG